MNCIFRFAPAQSLTRPFPFRRPTYTLVPGGHALRVTRHGSRRLTAADTWSPSRGMWDCSLFAKPDNDPELTGVDASGRDRPSGHDAPVTATRT